jgi:hypothetical protein
MTAAGHGGKWLIALALLGVAPILALAPPTRTSAQTTERIVIDPRTGLAINGFDPVGYFTDAQPMLGRPELEYPFAGAVWRFRNEGNRAAFAGKPEIYMPRFGGYDPMAIARGLAAPGHPMVWLIVDKRLYLFRNMETRDLFIGDQRQAIEAAEAKWPSVQASLVQ